MIRKFYDSEHFPTAGELISVSMEDVMAAHNFISNEQTILVVQSMMSEWAAIQCRHEKKKADYWGEQWILAKEQLATKESAIKELVEYFQRIAGGERPDATYMAHLIQKYKK